MTEATEKTEADLAAEAAEVGLDLSAYAELTPRERGLVRARHARQLRGEARRFGINESEYLALSKEKREEIKEERRARVADKLKPKNGSAGATSSDDETDDEEPEVYTARDPVPPREADPIKRDKMTIGDIEELAPPPLSKEELAHLQREPPATLMDIYARWPIGEPDRRYRIRVERVSPKAYQNIACAGFVGDITEPISEAQFQAYFGGREYDLTLYGPDPSGKHDSVTGMPRVVKLTRPFRVTVPVLPPNMAVLPAVQQQSEPEEKNMLPNPFAVAAPPATAADAQMHKTNVDFMQSTIKMEREERDRRDREVMTTQKTLVETLQKQHQEVLETERRNSDRAITAEREARTELQRKLDKLERDLETATGKRGVEAIEILKQAKTSETEAVAATAKMYAQQIDGMREQHRDSIERQKETHELTLRTLREQHAQELRRLDERIKEQETYYNRKLDDERRKADEREKQLKDEVDRVRREEREHMEQRMTDLKERYEDRLKDLASQHRRELESARETFETRKEVSDAQLKMQITSLEERCEELRERAEKAETEAEANKDPAAIMEKWERDAEKLGFKKEKDDLKGWDRFASMAGAGVGDFLQNAHKWAPELISAIRNRPTAPLPGVPQLGPGGQAQPGAQQQAQQRPPQRRAVAWANEGDPAARPSVVPRSELGFQGAPPATEQAPAPAVETKATEQQPPAQQAPPAAPPAQPEQQVFTFNNIFRDVFSDQQVFEFLQRVEVGINGMEPSDFASMFVARFPDESAKLVRDFSESDIVGFVRSLKNAEASPILRRDGADWIDKMLKSTKKLVAKNKAA